MRRVASWALLLCAACGGRNEAWDAQVEQPTVALGLGDAVALVDAPADRALILPVRADLDLAPVSLPIGLGFATAATTPDGERLIVLSQGVVPRRTAEDEGASLTLIGTDGGPHVADRYEIGEPLTRLAVDPESRFAVAYPSATDGSLVHNPNELVVFDLTEPPSEDNPVELTLRSFGGQPERLTFTSPLGLPGGERRLLIVESDRDVSLLDLSDLTVPEITIPLTSGADPVAPAAVAVSDGAPERDDDTRIAVRLASDANVVLVDLLPVSEDTPQGYRAAPNVVFVGGVPSDVAFVQTDGGLRLAALVPSEQALTLIDPLSGIATAIDLGAPFERISLVTSIVGAGEDGSDVALLWSGASAEIAFVALGSTVGKPYQAIERTALSEPVAELADVPAPNGHLKILKTTGGSFFVLDVTERTASPIQSSASQTRLTLAPVGDRAWISASTSELARLDLGSLHPQNLSLSGRVDRVFDISREDGGRALVALHASGALGATVLDADAPSLATAREHFGLLLEGLP